MNLKPTRTAEQAVSDGFVILRDRTLVLSVYAWHCRENNQPCVVIRPRGKYVTLEFMLGATTYQFTQEALGRIACLLNLTVPEKYRSQISITPGMVYTNWLPSQYAVAVAQAISDVSQDGVFVQPRQGNAERRDVIAEATSVIEAALNRRLTP